MTLNRGENKEYQRMYILLLSDCEAKVRTSYLEKVADEHLWRHTNKQKGVGAPIYAKLHRREQERPNDRSRFVCLSPDIH